MTTVSWFVWFWSYFLLWSFISLAFEEGSPLDFNNDYIRCWGNNKLWILWNFLYDQNEPSIFTSFRKLKCSSILIGRRRFAEGQQKVQHDQEDVAPADGQNGRLGERERCRRRWYRHRPIGVGVGGFQLGRNTATGRPTSKGTFNFTEFTGFRRCCGWLIGCYRILPSLFYEFNTKCSSVSMRL